MTWKNPSDCFLAFGSKLLDFGIIRGFEGGMRLIQSNRCNNYHEFQNKKKLIDIKYEKECFEDKRNWSMQACGQVSTMGPELCLL